MYARNHSYRGCRMYCLLLKKHLVVILIVSSVHTIYQKIYCIQLKILKKKEQTILVTINYFLKKKKLS